MWYLQSSDMLGHLPDFYRELQQVCTLAVPADEALDHLRSGLREIVDGWYVQADSEAMLQNWEQLFSREENWKLSMQKRRQEILACFCNRPPVNTYRVVQVCLAMLGEGSTLRLDVDEQKFICYVKYRAVMEPDVERRIYDKVRQMIPANLTIELAYDYNEWQQMRVLTWQQAGSKTWTEMLTAPIEA